MIIDNILTNDLMNHSAGVLETDISDHLPVFLIVDSMYNNVQNRPKFKKRHINNNNIQQFVQELNATDWNLIFSQNNVNDTYNNFLDQIIKLYDKNFPLKEVKCRYNKYKSPWLSAGIYNSIRRKNFLYKKWVLNVSITSSLNHNLVLEKSVPQS